MFNSFNYNPTQKVSINSVSGTLAKTCEKSFFVYAQIGSDYISSLMGNNPYIFLGHVKKPIVILQMMCIGDRYMMFEIILKEDFEELKEVDSHE